ncbi:cupin domain-containing protein [Synechocystis sp. PCC 7509]|uniref:cupin domain-containing protein n=1 Tax=Synechocystis sp. PCC 7509 TaxID=927677 RepID=UPI0002AC673C|nr:cupin domain-containing protein [Synechocystis sp. PCC 7509]
MKIAVTKSRFFIVLVLAFTLILVMANGSFATPKFKFPKVIADKNPLHILGPAGERFTFVKTGATTCGKYVMAEATVPPGGGPLPHIHHYTDEWFYFPKGGLTLEMGSNTFPDLNVVPGLNAPKELLHMVKTTRRSLFYGPRYYVHGFVNNTKKPQKLVFIWTPDDAKVGITNYFKEVGQPLPDPANPPAIDPKNKALFVSQGTKYGINQSSDFYQYVNSTDYKFPTGDNHAKELLALLSPDVKGRQTKDGVVSCK